MLQFTHSSFELDLTYLKVVFTEENQWFENDDFASEYSFPFDIPVSLWNKINGFAHYNATGYQTRFKGKLYRDGILTDATLQIKEHKADFVSAVIFTGLSKFPTFDKSLNELSLDHYPVASIRGQALQNIRLNYPETSHNFPMIHTDKYDTNSVEFKGFLMIMNHYRGDSFVESILRDNDVDLIQNIMQPLPYLMHVINRGVIDAGYQLSGDILRDDDLSQALIYRDGNYYEALKGESIAINVLVSEWYQLAGLVNNIQHVSFEKRITITRNGDYRLLGDLFFLQYTRLNINPLSSDLLSRVFISIGVKRGNVTIPLYSGANNETVTNAVHTSVIKNSQAVDIPVTLLKDDVLIILKMEPRRDLEPNPSPPEAIALDLIPIRFKDSNGNPLATVLDLNEINLKRVVPDMSFGTLISIIRKWKNYDFYISGQTVYMNRIEPQLDRRYAKNLERHDIAAPLRTFHDERSYEISFADGRSNENYRYDSVYVDRTKVDYNSFLSNDNTTKISIEGLPYPVTFLNRVTTAYAFDDDISKLRLVFYQKVNERQVPICYQNDNMLIPSVFSNNYRQWISFRLNSVGYTWEFIISVEDFKEVVIQSIIYAYDNYHVFTEIERERIDHLFWRITAKTETLQTKFNP